MPLLRAFVAIFRIQTTYTSPLLVTSSKQQVVASQTMGHVLLCLHSIEALPGVQHCCAGRAGSALALLAPHETAYVEFLRLRRVPLAELDAAATLAELPDMGAEVRALAEADRDVMEKGTRAFVSWVSFVHARRATVSALPSRSWQ